jgi:hypothetical protein
VTDLVLPGLTETDKVATSSPLKIGCSPSSGSGDICNMPFKSRMAGRRENCGRVEGRY